MSKMNKERPFVYLARHGETAWSLTGQHTGLTDLPLTKRGEQTACRLGERLKGLSFAKVFTSPVQRAVKTCELAGFAAGVEIYLDLVEWNYGEYEGRCGVEIRVENPDGCPGGESPVQVAVRAERVINRVRDVNGNVLLFTSGHLIHVLATSWIGLEQKSGCRSFRLNTASLSALGYEESISRSVIQFWNDTQYVLGNPFWKSQ